VPQIEQLTTDFCPIYCNEFLRNYPVFFCLAWLGALFSADEKFSLTFKNVFLYNKYKLLAGEGSSLAPLPFPFSNLGASPASASLDKSPHLCLLFSSP